MKRFLIIFILLVPFISYADGNGNGDCINYNDEIQNLIKSNDYYSTYEYLRYSYLDYYKKCGNTDDLKLLVDKYEANPNFWTDLKLYGLSSVFYRTQAI